MHPSNPRRDKRIELLREERKRAAIRAAKRHSGVSSESRTSRAVPPGSTPPRSNTVSAVRENATADQPRRDLTPQTARHKENGGPTLGQSGTYVLQSAPGRDFTAFGDTGIYPSYSTHLKKAGDSVDRVVDEPLKGSGDGNWPEGQAGNGQCKGSESCETEARDDFREQKPEAVGENVCTQTDGVHLHAGNLSDASGTPTSSPRPLSRSPHGTLSTPPPAELPNGDSTRACVRHCCCGQLIKGVEAISSVLKTATESLGDGLRLESDAPPYLAQPSAGRDQKAAEDVQRLSQRVSGLDSTLENRSRCMSGLKLEVEQHKTSIDTLEKGLKAVRTECNTACNEGRDASRDVKRAKDDLDCMESRVGELQSRLQGMNSLGDRVRALEATSSSVAERVSEIALLREELGALMAEVAARPPPAPKRTIWVLAKDEYLAPLIDVIAYLQKSFGSGCHVRGDIILPQEYDPDNDVLVVAGVQTSTRIDMNFGVVEEKLEGRTPNHMLLLVVQRSGTDKPAGAVAQVDASAIPFRSQVFQNGANTRDVLLQVVVGYSSFVPHSFEACSVNRSTARSCKLIAEWLGCYESE